jgi:signal transduction histidine kinase
MLDATKLQEGLNRSALATLAVTGKGEIEGFNDAAVELFGSLEGLNLSRPNAQDDPLSALASLTGFWESMQDETDFASPSLLRAKSEGSSLYLWINVVPTGSNGTGGFLFLVANLTAQVSGSEPVRKLVSQLAHDLRSPLTSISGAAELLLSGRVGGLETVQQKLVRIVDEGATKMATIITTVSTEERDGGSPS